jgi:hypothetical protein
MCIIQGCAAPRCVVWHSDLGHGLGACCVAVHPLLVWGTRVLWWLRQDTPPTCCHAAADKPGRHLLLLNVPGLL